MSSSPIAISLRQVSKRFQKRTIRREYTTLKSELVRVLLRRKQPISVTHLTALHDINLEIPVGKTMGVIGRNGAGKSTLLKLITGIYAPSEGKIEVNGRISALLELGAGFHPDFSGRENILINGIILGMTRAEALAKMPEIIAFSELGDFIDEPVRTYSSGMYMRLAFSVATHVDPDILIVDEILAVGDAHFSHKSLGKMTEFKRQGKTILLVTHDLGSVEQWCDMAAWLDGGTIRAIGNPRDVVQQYQAEVARTESTRTLSTPRLADAVVINRPKRGPQVPWEQRFGSFAAEIDEVQVRNPVGSDPLRFTPDDALEVTLDCTLFTPVPELVVHVIIRREEGGAELLGTSTRNHGVAVSPPVGGTAHVKLHLDRLGLAGGNYRVDVAVRDPAGTDLDCHRGLYGFQVQADPREGGLLRPPLQWQVSLDAVPTHSEAANS
jgi:lipopolysaccharide transport system ATP-binding protein